MESVLSQLTTSNLSLDGTRGYAARQFGYRPAPSPIETAVADALHRDYSLDGNPNTSVVDFNGSIFNKPPTTLNETNPIAPQNTQAGTPGSVVQQTYSFLSGQEYQDKGPVGGHY
jgi:hypothetical protein